MCYVDHKDLQEIRNSFVPDKDYCGQNVVLFNYSSSQNVAKNYTGVQNSFVSGEYLSWVKTLFYCNPPLYEMLNIITDNY